MNSLPAVHRLLCALAAAFLAGLAAAERDYFLRHFGGDADVLAGAGAGSMLP